MRPRVLSVARQRLNVDLLTRVQIVKCFGEQMNSVVHQSSFGLDHRLVGLMRHRCRWLFIVLYVELRPLGNCVTHKLIIRINKTKRRDVCAAVFELLQIECLQILREQKNGKFNVLMDVVVVIRTCFYQ